MRTLRYVTVASFVSLALVGCGTQVDGSRTAHSRPSSVGSGTESGRVLVIPAGPDLSIGLDTGGTEYLLSGVVAALRTRGGDILVADAGASDIKLFDSTGAWRRTTGRPGSGPGEFANLLDVVRCTDGGFVARDLGSKLVAYSDTVALIDEFAQGSDFADAMLLGCDTPHDPIALREGDGRVPPGGGLVRLPVRIVRGGIGAARRDTLATFAGTEYFFSRRGPYFLDVPLGARTIVVVTSGRLVVGESDRDSITIVPLDGSPRRTIVHGLERSPLGAGDFERAFEERLSTLPFARTRKMIAPIRDEMPHPARFPYFDALVADDEGQIWLRTFEGYGAGHRIWRVFAADGALAATVRLPAGLQVTEIARGTILGIARDSTGGERVVRYQIDGASRSRGR